MHHPLGVKNTVTIPYLSFCICLVAVPQDGENWFDSGMQNFFIRCIVKMDERCPEEA